MTTNLTNKQALSLYQALFRLDPPDTQGQPSKNRPSYLFKGKATYAFARNLKKLKSVVEDLEKVRVELFKKHRTGEEESLSGAAATAFTAEFQDVLDMKQDIALLQVDVADLDLDRNPVPADVLAELLDAIVTGEIK